MNVEEAKFLTQQVNRQMGSYKTIERDIKDACYKGSNSLYRRNISVYSLRKLRRNGFTVVEREKNYGTEYEIRW